MSQRVFLPRATQQLDAAERDYITVGLLYWEEFQQLAAHRTWVVDPIEDDSET